MPFITDISAYICSTGQVRGNLVYPLTDSQVAVVQPGLCSAFFFFPNHHLFLCNVQVFYCKLCEFMNSCLSSQNRDYFHLLRFSFTGSYKISLQYTSKCRNSIFLKFKKAPPQIVLLFHTSSLHMCVLMLSLYVQQFQLLLYFICFICFQNKARQYILNDLSLLLTFTPVISDSNFTTLYIF